MAERLTVYVDGFNLYNGLHDRWARKYLWLDLAALARALRPRSSLTRVRYFTAAVLSDPSAASRQSAYIAALKAHSGGLVEVTNGRYQGKPVSCRSCGQTYTRYEEKETDVNIALSLLGDAVDGSMDAALLISGDSDLAPAVRAMRARRPEIFVAAAFPPKRHSAELKALMPASFHIGPDAIRQSQLPAVVNDLSTGNRWERPPKWQ